jgi:hypothetical protein
VYKHLVHIIMMGNSFMKTKKLNENRPEACIQAFGAHHHDDKQFYEHNEWPTKTALKLVYKHLVHMNMMIKMFMNTNDMLCTLTLDLTHPLRQLTPPPVKMHLQR